MTNDHLTPREFSILAGIPYTTAVHWFRKGCLKDDATQADDGTWSVPRAVAERIIAGRKKAELDEDRLALALDFFALSGELRKEQALHGAVHGVKQLVAAHTALSPEQQEDPAFVLPLIEPLLRAMKKVDELPLLANLLDEMNRQTRDDEFGDAFSAALTERERAAVEAKRLEDDRTGDF